MTKSKWNKSGFHFIVIMLLIIGMGAGYFWMPVVGIIMEIAFWIYVGLFVEGEQKDVNE
jgi:hypothetical protein